jgi:hypothetical protein
MTRVLERLAASLDPSRAGLPWPIPKLYDRLSPVKVTGGDGDGRRAPGFRSASPANTHAIALRDPRSKANGRAWTAADGRVHHEPARGLLHAPTVLAGWYAVVCEYLGEDEPEPGLSVTALGFGLCDRLDELARADWLPDMADEVRTLHGQLRTALASVTGEHRARPIGRCAVELGDGAPCGNPLWVPRHGDCVSCTQCGAYWPRQTWVDAAVAMTAS